MKPSIGGPLENHAARIAALEAELAALKRLIKASGLASVSHDDTLSGDGTAPDPLSAADLSGSIDAAIHSLSGSVNSAIQAVTSGGLTFVTTDNTLAGDGTALNPLSAASLSSSIDSSIKSYGANSYSSLQVGITSSISDSYVSLQTGVTASIAGLSGTINARFLNVTGSLISSVSNVYNSLSAGISGSIAGTTNTVPKFTSAHSIGNSQVTDDGTTVSVGKELSVAGSITGSGQSLLSTALLSNPWPSGSGVRTVVTLDDSSGAKRAGDGQRLRFTFGSFNYNAWIAAVTTRANPDFLNPRLEFAVQQPFTTGLGNVTASLIVYGESVEVTGSARVQGAITGSALRISDGAAGSVSDFGIVNIETPSDTYVSFKAGTGNESGLLFNTPSAVADGALVYSRDRILQLRAGGNITRMSIDTSGDASFTGDVLVTGSLATLGAVYLGASQGLSHVISGNVSHVDDGAGSYLLTSTPAGRTANLTSAWAARTFGTFDTSAGDLISQTAEIRAESTTTGSNLLTNRALRLNASGGDVNQALVVASGDVILNATTGTTYFDADVVLGSSNANAIWFKGRSVTDLNLNSFRIVNLTDPSAPQDAATKAYVDSLSGSAASGIAALSATINSRFLNVTGSMISSFSKLSGTINARFLNITGSLISGLSETYSSLQTGISSSIADLSGTIDAQRMADGVDPVRSISVFDDYLIANYSINSKLNATYTTLAGAGAGWIFLFVLQATKDIAFSRTGELGWLPRPQNMRIIYDSFAALNQAVTVGGPEQSRVIMGFSDSSASFPQANGFFWENDPGHGSSNWYLVAVNSSTRVQGNSGLAADLNNHHFRIEMNEACTAITGTIDGGNQVILTGSGIPNSFNPIAPLAQIYKISGSAGQHALWLDYQWGHAVISGAAGRR